jgi:hypothetical protein
MSIIIEKTNQYSGIFLTLAAWYDGDQSHPIFIKEIHCSESGTASYITPEIEVGYDNITFFVDYAGTSTISYNASSLILNILPKWLSNITLEPLPSNIRIGQIINLNISGKFVDSLSSESFYGLPFDILFIYNNINTTEHAFFGNQSRFAIQYEIPQNVGNQLNISIIFFGTNKIQGFILEKSISILSKWGITIALRNLPSLIRYGQSLDLQIQGTFNDADCPETTSIIPIKVIIESGSMSKIMEGTLNQYGNLSMNWVVPLSASRNLTITISTTGSNRIGSYSTQIFRNITDQLKTKLLILHQEFQQGFNGEFFFSIKLLDQENNSLSGQMIIFLVKNSQKVLIANYSAITNANGTASISIPFDIVGSYTIDIVFSGQSVYAAIDSTTLGISSQVKVVDVGTIILDNLGYILLTIGIAIASGLIINKTVIYPRKIRQRNALMEIHRKFADIENIQYILVIHHETSLALFSRAFTEIPIDETLISGFLSAISSFGAEIGAKVTHTVQDEKQPMVREKGGIEELAYKQFKIVVIDGEFIRTAVLLLKSASPTLQIKIGNFNKEFEKRYRATIENWDGKVPDAQPIMTLVEEFLNADLLYPHNVIPSKVHPYLKTKKKKSIETLIINEAQSQNFANTFRVREMLNRMTAYGKKEVDTFNSIYGLRKFGIVFAVNPRTKYLIDQFKPIINAISDEAKMLLKEIIEGNQIKEKIEKKLKTSNLDPLLSELITQNIIKEDLQLTDIGEILGTLMKMIPDF